MGKALWPLTAALLAAADPAQAACEKFVALFPSAEYMVLDPADLRMLDVGELTWLGIRLAGPVAAGSSLRQTMTEVSDFRRIGSREHVWGNERLHPPVSVLYLENLGKGIESQEQLEFEPDSIASRFQWSPWLGENTLTWTEYLPDAEKKFVLQHVDRNFERLRSWNPLYGRDDLPRCATEDTIYLTDRLEFATPGGTIREWGAVAVNREDGSESSIMFDEFAEENFRFPNSNLQHFRGCRNLVVRPGNDVRPAEGALFDISTGEILSLVPFTLHDEAGILFDRGYKLLQHTRNLSFGAPENSRDPFRSSQSQRFLVIDTLTGATLVEKTLDVGSGTLHTEMYCDEETPRALVIHNRTIYLIDPNDLTIIASRELPFDDFVIFE